jgi:hypothetical protein
VTNALGIEAAPRTVKANEVRPSREEYS